MRVRCLTPHAHYQCANTGVCCTVGWSIPIEKEIHHALTQRLESGSLKSPHAQIDPLFVTAGSLPAEMGAVFAHTPEGHCVFLEEGERRLCSIHRQCGEQTLPQACRHFPRVAVLTPQGVDVNLSHFCPTALKSLLEHTGPLTIEEAPPAFPADFGWEGLDARAGLPPALRPNCLTTWEAFETWETMLVEALSASDKPWQSLRMLARATERVCAWSPSDEKSLIETMRDSIAQSQALHHAEDTPTPDQLHRMMDAVTESIPLPLRAPLKNPSAMAIEGALLSRHLACRAFANWSAHQGQSLRTWISHLVCVAACVTLQRAPDIGEAIRQADLMLLHHADPTALTRILEQRETEIWEGLLSP